LNIRRRVLGTIISVAAVSMFIAPAASAGTIVNAVPLTPTNMTEFSPTRNDADYAGKYMTIASNPKTGKNLFAYPGYTSVGGVYGYYYGAQVTDASGPVGPETVLASIASGCAYSGSVQMASAFNPVTGGWVVAYKEGCGDFLWKAQFLNADGALDGSPVTISSPTPDTDSSLADRRGLELEREELPLRLAQLLLELELPAELHRQGGRTGRNGHRQRDRFDAVSRRLQRLWPTFPGLFA